MAETSNWMERLHAFDRAAWCLAAVVAAARNADAAGLAVAQLLGIEPPDDPAERSRLAATAAAPLLQASKFISGGLVWQEQDDAALLAQGRASAAAGNAFPQLLFPQLPDGRRLSEEPARMLDVGVGVAAMAVALCQALPHLSIVGIDVLARPLQLARENIAAAGLEDRIELRHLSVADLDDVGEFDLAWLPAPFIPRLPLEEGLSRVVTALRPGGWLLLGHGRLGGDPLDDAVTRFKTVVYGGTPLDGHEARHLLQSVGLEDVRSLSSPQGAPAFAVGRRPTG